jgi:hypothetical protein
MAAKTPLKSDEGTVPDMLMLACYFTLTKE